MAKIDTERSIETELCVDTFLKAFTNGTGLVKYSEIAEVTRIPAISAGAGCVSSARRILRNQHKIDTEAERGIGIRRLNNSQKAQSDSSKKIYRAAKRQIKIHEHVIYDELPEEEKQPFNARATQHQFLAYAASNKIRQKLIDKVPVSPERIQLPITETMELVR